MREALTALREEAGLKARLGGATFRWPATLVLEDIGVVGPHDSPAADIPVSGVAPEGELKEGELCVRLSRVELELNVGALLERRVEVDRVHVQGAGLRLDRASLEPLRGWVEQILARPSRKRRDVRLPEIRVDGARLILPKRGGDGTTGERSLEFTVDAGAADSAGGDYEVRWKCLDDAEAGGAVRIGLNEGAGWSMQGATPWLSIADVAAVLDAWSVSEETADRAEDWVERLGADGAVRLSDVTWRERPGESAETRASLEWRMPRLSIPINEADRRTPPTERYTVFESVEGSARISRDALTGTSRAVFHGAECSFHIEAALRELNLEGLASAGLRIVAEVRGLELPADDVVASPAQARFIRSLPSMVKFYERYAPAGRVNARVVAVKEAGAGGSWSCPMARVEVLDGRASYYRFPYPGEGLTGTIEYNPLGLFIRELRGRHGSTDVAVNAYVEELTGPALTRVSIEGTNVALDADLHAALPESFRRTWDLFEPEGSADVHVFIERPGEGRERPNTWSNLIVAELKDVSATYARFPYRVDDVTGTLTILDDHFHASCLNGRHGAGALGIDGRVEYIDRAPAALDLHIEARGVAVEEDLLRSLPAGMRGVVDRMSPKGTIDASCALTLGPRGEVRYDVDINPRSLQVTPSALPVRVENLSGRVYFGNDRIELSRVAGTHGSAVIRADGVYRLEEEGASTDLSLTCDRIELTDALRQSLPSTARRALEAWDVTGPVAIATRISPRAGGADVPPVMRHTLTLCGNGVRRRDWPAPIEDVRGEIHVEDGALASFELTGALHDAQVEVTASRESASGTAAYSGSAKVTGLRLEEPVFRWAPEGVRSALSQVAATGFLDVALQEWRMIPEDGAAAWRVRGSARLHGVCAPGAGSIRGATGTVTFSGQVNEPRGYASFEGLALLDEVFVLGRQVTEASSTWSLVSSPQPWTRLTLEDVKGACYGGLVTGEVEVLSSGRVTDYDLGVQVAGLELRQYLADPARQRTEAFDAEDAEGLIDGQMSLSGRVGSTLTRTGEGRLTARDARLYRLPPIGAVLRMINLAATQEEPVQQARTTFSLRGDEIEFHDLYLRDPGVALSGYGTGRMPDQRLDLRLIAVSPHQWARVPVLSELVEGASRELVEIQVTGTLLKPVVRSEPLRGIRSALDALLEEARPHPADRANPPIPPARPK
ncbi:MAG: hypothetical protein FLDDKLPJ_00583 [Phycisphaerae bacterium]|nr:hypothetical protein [Phycisphaerae bacterium]